MTQIYRTFEPLPLNSGLTLRFSPKLPSSHGHSTTLSTPTSPPSPCLWPYVMLRPSEVVVVPVLLSSWPHPSAPLRGLVHFSFFLEPSLFPLPTSASGGQSQCQHAFGLQCACGVHEGKKGEIYHLRIRHTFCLLGCREVGWCTCVLFC